MASDVKYMTNQISCHDSNIYDHDWDLRELMGMVDIIKDEVTETSKDKPMQSLPGFSMW